MHGGWRHAYCLLDPSLVIMPRNSKVPLQLVNLGLKALFAEQATAKCCECVLGRLIGSSLLISLHLTHRLLVNLEPFPQLTKFPQFHTHLLFTDCKLLTHQITGSDSIPQMVIYVSCPFTPVSPPILRPPNHPWTPTPLPLPGSGLGLNHICFPKFGNMH